MHKLKITITFQTNFFYFLNISRLEKNIFDID
jgi:hypothetical protein